MRFRWAGWVPAAFLTVVTMAVLAAAPGHSAAQSTADATADRFHRAIQLLRWDIVADVLHPEALALLRQRVDAIVELDQDGILLDETLGGASRSEYGTWTDRELFLRLMADAPSHMGGLVNVLATNEYRVIGAVQETDGRAHVVVETRPYASGPVPTRMQVVTVERHAGAWLVVEADELEAVRTAIMPVRRPPPLE